MFKGVRLKKIAAGVLVLLYAISFLTFVQAYFYQYPLLGKDDFSMRLVSRYAVLAAENGAKVVVLSPSSTDAFEKYLFYANAMNGKTIATVKKDFATRDYTVGNVTFASCSNTFPVGKNEVVISDVICGNTYAKPSLTIPLIKDGGAAYRIYQDTLCSNYTLKSFPSNLSVGDFHVEEMPLPFFCETFITR